MAHKTIQPEGWVRPKGYANGVLAAPGALLFVAGQIGWNGQEEFVGDDFLSQFDQALANVVAVVEAAGGSAKSITRLRIFAVDKTDYLSNLRDVGAIYRKHLGKHFPAMAMVQVSALIEDRALVEIEADAVIEADE